MAGFLTAEMVQIEPLGSGLQILDQTKNPRSRVGLSRNEEQVMLVGWAFLPVSELENTNSDGQECPSYESLKTQFALRSYFGSWVTSALFVPFYKKTPNIP